MASELKEVRQMVRKANYKLDVVESQLEDLQNRMNRMEAVLQRLVNPQARILDQTVGRCAPKLRLTEEPRTLPDLNQPAELEVEMSRRLEDLRQIVATGWEQDQLPNVSVRRIEWENPKDPEEVIVEHDARLEVGTVVSKSEGVEFTVKDRYFCPAFAQAVKTMKKAEKVLLKIKPQNGIGERGKLAAGEEGAVPPNAIFLVDLESVYALAMNDTGNLLVSGGTEKVVRVWDPGIGWKNMKMRHEVEEERNMLQMSKVWQQRLFKEPEEKQLSVSGHYWGRIEISGNMLSSNVVTKETFEVEPNTEVKVIPDIEVTTDGTKYTFSDGIGKMSLRFAMKVAHKIGLDYNNPLSAFQIRYGGYKGVIAADPTTFRNLSVRPSMKKFESESTMLNITSWSKSQPCYVNREIISLLSTMGIRDEIFESMQQNDMRESDEMLTNREVVLSALGKIGGAEIKTALKMLLQGYEPSSEPYLLMVLKAHQENRLSDIRARCKIHVPKGRVLLGCLDETGKLEYGQVYIRITKNSKEHKDDNQPYFYDDNGETAVVVGKIAISKNPCLLPGDIRVLEAVYDPTMNLVDCVVFPQKGERPHPNECPGGDLDGDLYFITWEDKLIPEKVDTPMDYTATRPRIMDRVVTLEEIQKYFADYMLNDALGVISTAHLIHADRQPLKARSPECLQLAALHSMAVDFAKTGAPAEMPWSLRPREFPDFMGRWDKPMYISNGVLGKFYRAAVSHMESSEALASLVQSSPRYDPDLEVPGFEEFLEAAEEYYHLYAEKLKNDQEHLFRNMPRNEYHNLFNFIIGKYLKILNLEMGRKDMDFVQLLVTLQNSRFISRWIWSGRGKNWCVAERLGKIYPGGIDRFKKVQTLEPFSMYSGLGAKNAPVVVRTGKSPLAPLTLLQNSHFGPS